MTLRYRLPIFALFLITLLLMSFKFSMEKELSFFNDNFQPVQDVRIEKVCFLFPDSIPNDTLYFCYSKDDLPVFAYRNVKTKVCDDGLCKVIDVRLFWTITGRYLGYLLQPGRILTKVNHKPFVTEDYQLLHKLLSDSLSLLKNYGTTSFQNNDADYPEIDATTGATSLKLSDFTVHDAAYTTITLWHAVYSGTRDSIMTFVSKRTTPQMIDSLLSSKIHYDVCWSLDMIKYARDYLDLFYPDIIKLLSNGDKQIFDKSIQCLDALPLLDSIYQENLLGLFFESNFNTKRLALERLNKFATLDSCLVSKWIERLQGQNYFVVSQFLGLIKSKYQPADKDIKLFCLLLNRSNRQIASKVFEYLSQLPTKNRKLKCQLNEYLKSN